MDNLDIVTIKSFPDERPKDTTMYFKQQDREGDISVVIPFYNEEANELAVTLKSLYGTYDYLCEIKPVYREKQIHVCIIQDGWYKASESMKEYLKRLYPKKYDGVDWWDHHKHFKNFSLADDGSWTYIFESDDYVCINPDEKEEYLKLYMKVTLVVKIDNRRKHNSHEWYMAKTGFAESVNSKYMFFTDAFTLYGPSCLYHLVNTLDNNNKYSAATGRQRVMSKYQQGTNEGMFSLANMLRKVQMYDFEMANAVYNGAFSLGGCLPVIPGPCGLYRGSDVLQDKVRDWYFGVVSVDPDKTGLVLGNLKIAEDRILTYSSVLKTQKQRYMAFVSLSVFYFEGELELKRFILQRRRWINGSVAGYLYLLFTDGEHVRQWRTNIFRKLYIMFLLFCQFLIYCSVSIAPAYSLFVFNDSLKYILTEIDYHPEYATYATIGAWVLYASHVYIHNRKKYEPLIMNLLLLFSMIVTVVSLAGISLFFMKEKDALEEQFLKGGNPLLWLIAIVFIVPFILAFMLSLRGHSVINMIKAFIPYVLFLHMLISWFGSYSYSRTWDLTWGNRPSGESEGDKDKREEMKKKYQDQGKQIAFWIFCLNIFIYLIPREWKLNILSVFFICVLIQMGFSVLYMLTQFPRKLKYIYLKCCKRKDMSDIEEDDEIRMEDLINDDKNLEIDNCEDSEDDRSFVIQIDQ